jgi:alkylation response protein AidB-like acyl-CoA dehydrogenase
MASHTTEHLDDADQRSFRLRARAWLSGRLPPRLAEEPAMDWQDEALVARDRQIQRMLWDGGLAGITVPKAYGGQGLDKRYEDILWEEAEPYRLPWHFGNAFNVVMPTLLAHGSERLKTLYIPAMLRGDHIWCQLLSEPSGGSDLAGLQTRATKRGDKWLLNGSKVWTTGAAASDMGICLARTDPNVPKHAGLTMFLVDMRAPGMTIRPLTLIRGNSDFCQEFMDDLEVPEDHVVGEVDGGWTVATTHLANERAGMARGWHMGLRRAAEADHLELDPALVALARELGRAADPQARQLVGKVFVLNAIAMLTNRRVARGMRSGALPATAGAVPSLMAARTDAWRTAYMSELAGPAGVASPIPADLEIGYSRVCVHRIGGGTLETQLNSVSERYLGLPREPAFDRDVPFNQLRRNAMPTAGEARGTPSAPQLSPRD